MAPFTAAHPGYQSPAVSPLAAAPVCVPPAAGASFVNTVHGPISAEAFQALGERAPLVKAVEYAREQVRFHTSNLPNDFAQRELARWKGLLSDAAVELNLFDAAHVTAEVRAHLAKFPGVIQPEPAVHSIAAE